MSELVNQPTNAPTRKVMAAVVSAATIGQALGGALCDLALEVATLSPWLAWGANEHVQMLVFALGTAGGTLVGGWLARERAP